MTKKNTDSKHNRRTTVKSMPKHETALTPKHARKIKGGSVGYGGGKAFQIISAGPDDAIAKK